MPPNTDHLDDTTYDVAIAGSGLEESFLAGALARSGLRVLHLDENNFYGGDWGTLTLRELLEKARAAENGEVIKFPEQDDIETTVPRGWNIDLTPKGVVSSGELVTTMIDSNVGRYLEFKRVDRSMVFTEGKKTFIDLPAGRSAVFSSGDLAPMEKRRLMQLMEFCKPETEIPEDWRDKPVQDFLKTHLKMSAKLISLVLYPILELHEPTEPCTTREAVERLKRIAESVGKYGPTDKIYCNYGVSEIAQALCRVCAIYRGVYILQRGVVEVVLGSDKKVTGVVCTAGQEFTCKHVVTSKGMKLNGVKGDVLGEARCVVIYKGSLFPPKTDEEGDVLQNATTCATIPPSSLGEGLPSRTVTVYETSHSTNSSPDGYSTLHLTQRGTDLSELRRVASRFIDFSTGKLLNADDDRNANLAVFFTLPSVHEHDIKVTNTDGYPAADSRIWLCDTPSGEASVDVSVKNARATFAKLMKEEKALRDAAPEEEEGPDTNNEVPFMPNVFLPRLRDPEGQQFDDPEAVMLGVTLEQEAQKGAEEKADEANVKEDEDENQGEGNEEGGEKEEGKEEA
eukprot:TRINITY_DN16970_c0_g1_i2.p1 TRINITY_DN16970_c0_g1~~TRINITY_DN16970_c0_g1_i2.p1  ORF type:complete len:581 (+),score=168.58 TRINITY_DN16970_c0_g1_i2:42-1745(+)